MTLFYRCGRCGAVVMALDSEAVRRRKTGIPSAAMVANERPVCVRCGARLAGSIAAWDVPRRVGGSVEPPVAAAAAPRCPVCGGELVTTPEGIIVCSRCGTVVDETPVDASREERRVFTPEEVASRRRAYAISPMSRVQASTAIEPVGALAQLHMKLVTDTVTQRMARLLDELHAPRPVRDEAFRCAARLRGLLRSIQLVHLAACVAIAMVSVGAAASLREAAERVAEALGIDAGRVVNAIRRVRRLGAARIVAAGQDGWVHKRIDELVGKLGLGGQVAGMAHAIAAAWLRLSRRKLKSATVAATAVYIAAAIHGVATMEQVAEAAGISDATIRSRYREAIDAVDIHVWLEARG